MQKTCGRWRERGVFFCFDLFHFCDVPTISEPGTGYKILTSSVYVFTTESHSPLAAQRNLMYHLPFLTLFQIKEQHQTQSAAEGATGGKQTDVTAYFARNLVPVGPGTIDYTNRISGSEFEH